MFFDEAQRVHLAGGVDVQACAPQKGPRVSQHGSTVQDAVTPGREPPEHKVFGHRKRPYIAQLLLDHRDARALGVVRRPEGNRRAAYRDGARVGLDITRQDSS